MTIEEFKVARAYCNDCNRPFDMVAPRQDLRSVMKRFGWSVGKNWRVTCPECREVEE